MNSKTHDPAQAEKDGGDAFLIQYLEEHHRITENAIGLARVCLKDNEPTEACGYLDKASEALDVIHEKRLAHLRSRPSTPSPQVDARVKAAEESADHVERVCKSAAPIAYRMLYKTAQRYRTATGVPDGEGGVG